MVVTGKFTEHLLCASHDASHTLDCLIFTTTLWDRHYYGHLTEEKIDSERDGHRQLRGSTGI